MSIENNPHRSILVLTDFGSCSRHAADYSLVLARKFEADILLFHSYFVPVSAFDSWPAEQYPAMRENGLSKLKQEAERLQQLNSPGNGFQPQIEYLAEGGAVAENVTALISIRHNILMVVMGGYRARNNDEFEYGTTIREVLGQARCPAVIVPEFEFLKE